jgi:hypothetical protein
MNSSNPPSSSQKFRPYLSLRQIERILQTLKGDPEPSDSELIASLEVLVWKAGKGLQKPSYVTVPSWEQKLEFSPREARKYNLNEKIELYNRWRHREPLTSFSPTELAVIQEYRCINNLMSAQEQAEYTNSLMESITGPDVLARSLD